MAYENQIKCDSCGVSIPDVPEPAVCGAAIDIEELMCEMCLIKSRLEYLRGEIEAERISYEEIAELQELSDYIEPEDVQLLQWAGVPEPGGDE